MTQLYINGRCRKTSAAAMLAADKTGTRGGGVANLRTWCSEVGRLWRGRRQSSDRRLLSAVLESMSASSGPQKGTRQSGGCGGSSVLFPLRLKAEGGTGYFVFLLATCPQGVCPGVECFPGHGCQVTLVLSIRRAWSRSWGRARCCRACRSCSESPYVARDLTIA